MVHCLSKYYAVPVADEAAGQQGIIANLNKSTEIVQV